MDGFSPGQERAIDALLSSPDLSKAAKTAGVDRRTLQRWLKDSAFLQAYQAGQREIRQQAIRYVSSAMIKASQVLISSLSNPKLPASTRAYLSVKTLEIGLKLQASEDFEARLATVERYLVEWRDNHANRTGAPLDPAGNGNRAPPA